MAGRSVATVRGSERALDSGLAAAHLKVRGGIGKRPQMGRELLLWSTGPMEVEGIDGSIG